MADQIIKRETSKKKMSLEITAAGVLGKQFAGKLSFKKSKQINEIFWKKKLSMFEVEITYYSLRIK